MHLPERLARLEAGERIVVSVQQRRIDFSDAEVPQIEVAALDVIKECIDPVDLMRFLERRVRQPILWWALDRQEECTGCGQGIDTSQLHWATAVAIEEPGQEGGDELVACWYPERFCLSCGPVSGGMGSPAARRRLH